MRQHASWALLAGLVAIACGASGSDAPSRPVTVAPASVAAAPAPPPTIASSAASSAAGPAPRAPAPANLDLSLSQPYMAHIVGRASDGRLLLEMGAWVDRGDPNDAHHLSIANTTYYAVLDAKHDCIEETLATPLVSAAGATNRVDDALAILAKDGVKDEIHRVWELARRFDLRAIGAVAFGADESHAFVEAQSRLYVRDAGGAFHRHTDSGVATRLAPSGDGARIALQSCPGGCSDYLFHPALFDVDAGNVRRLALGEPHEMVWSGGDLWLAYDDRGPIPPGRAASKVCIARLAAGAASATTVTCLPSIVYTENVASFSPSRRFVAVQTTQGGGVHSLVVLELPSGAEAQRIDASPVYPAVDDQGRVALDDAPPPGRRHRVRVARPGRAEEIYPDALSVGWLADGSLLTLPNAEAAGHMKHPVKLEAARCGLFATQTPAK